MDKDFYNEASSLKLGWVPEWFGAKYFDEDLVAAVKRWQRSNKVTADGLVGPMTYRRIWTERQAGISDYKPPVRRLSSAGANHIVHNGKFLPIDWPDVVLWDEDGGLRTKAGNYYDNSGKEDRIPTMFVNHWDVALSAESCANILNKRGISVHFCLDNDGTIYQMLDTQHGAWHCSKGAGNRTSIGIEISNGYYEKYQGWYVKNGFGERPVVSGGLVHGKVLKPFTGFYPRQIEALKALWKAIHMGLGVPLVCPMESPTIANTTVHKECVDGSFRGFCNHYNFVKGKIDCAGMDMLTMLEDVQDSFACEDG